MFAKGYSNVRAIIETQYGILSQLIYDVSNRYQIALMQFQENIEKIARENSNGDYDVYISILHNFEDGEDMRIAMSRESRKILFCSIFSYYESALNAIVEYYDIPKAVQAKQLYENINREYKKRYSGELNIDVDIANSANEFYRLLRNYFMHGSLYDGNDKSKLLYYIDMLSNGVKWYGNLDIEIENDKFLYESLDTIKQVLTIIENKYSEKAREDWKQLKKAKQYLAEAIKLYPSEYPGAEKDYPPYCSIEAHSLLLQAEQICVSLMKDKNNEVQTLVKTIRRLIAQMKK